jgi:DNA-binding winged helix-turn-helix (wHTH) protein
MSHILQKMESDFIFGKVIKEIYYTIPDINLITIHDSILFPYKYEKIVTKIFDKNKNEILDRQATLRAIWGDDNYFNGRSMDVYIAKLRKLLKEDPNIEIMNIHGVGFKLLIKE